jgi:hypothetical protein
MAGMKVAFFRGNHPGVKGWFGRLTKWWTRGPFSHVELVMCELGDLSVCWSSAFLDGGVRRVALDLRSRDWVVVDLPVSEHVAQAALSWFQHHRGQPYDVLGLFGFVFRPLSGEKRAWFCSEAVAAALGYRQSWRLDPNTFYEVLLAQAAHTVRAPAASHQLT